MKILLRNSFSDDFDIGPLRAQFPELEIVLIPAGDDVMLARELPGAEVVVGGGWTPELLDQARSLKWVQCTLAGTDTLPMAALSAKGIQVTTFRGASASPMAEHVLGLMLAFARGLPLLMRRQAARQWPVPPQRPAIFELRGQRVGIIGIGAIGTAIGEACAAMGMKVSVAARSERALPPAVSEMFLMDRLPEMLAVVDHLVLVLPSTTSTRGLIGERELNQMRKGSFIYNVGRGDCIDPDALVKALASGHLGGAGLDVTAPEPLLESSPLWEMPNVIITAHTSGWSPLRAVRGMEVITDNIERYVQGKPLRNLAA